MVMYNNIIMCEEIVCADHGRRISGFMVFLLSVLRITCFTRSGVWYQKARRITTLRRTQNSVSSLVSRCPVVMYEYISNGCARVVSNDREKLWKLCMINTTYKIGLTRSSIFSL